MFATLQENEEVPIMGSRNHSYVQANLIVALDKLEHFAVYSELSLEINGLEYNPDVCIYDLNQGVESFLDDIIRMQDMPLLAIEILSPRQFSQIIIDKFKAYFKAGIQSCWLVIPNAKTILVYNDLETIIPFSSGILTDPKLQISIPLQTIFRERHSKRS
jgi:Uma2 family endonuclease